MSRQCDNQHEGTLINLLCDLAPQLLSRILLRSLDRQLADLHASSGLKFCEDISDPVYLAKAALCEKSPVAELL